MSESQPPAPFEYCYEPGSPGKATVFPGEGRIVTYGPHNAWIHPDYRAGSKKKAMDFRDLQAAHVLCMTFQQDKLIVVLRQNAGTFALERQM